MAKRKLSKVELEQRRRAARKHGLRAFEARGEASLYDPRKIERLSDLRALVAKESGRLEIRQELTARMGLLVELGFDSLRERYSGDHLTPQLKAKLWSDPVIARLATYAALLHRLLNSFPEDKAPDEAAKILNLIREDSDDDTDQ